MAPGPVPPPHLPRRPAPARVACAAAVAALALAAPALAALPGPAAAQIAKAAAGASPPPAGGEKPPEKAREAPPAAIELTSVLRAGEVARATLRRLEERVEDDAVLREVLARRPAAEESTARLEAAAAPARVAELSTRDLFDLRQVLARSEQVLARQEGRLEDAAKGLHAAVRELERAAETWRLTEASARAEGAPPELLEAVAQLRTRIRELEGRARARLAETLAGQEAVASLSVRVGELSARLDRAERVREEQLFEIESVPLWRLLARPEKVAKMGEQISRSFQIHARSLRAFAEEERVALALLGAGFVGLALALARLARRFRARAEEDPALRAPAEVVSHPVAAAALLALGAVPFVFPGAPTTVQEVTILGMLLAFARAMGGIIPPGLRRVVYAFGATFAVERLGSLVPDPSLVGRLGLLGVAALALGGLVWTMRGQDWFTGIASAGWRRGLRGVGVVSAALLAGSIVSNVVGNVSLARLLGRSTLASLALGILVGGVATVVGALWVGTLHLPAARRIGVVERHGALLEVRGTRWVARVGLATWALAAVSAFRLRAPVADAARAALSLRLQVGGLDVSLGDLVAFGVTLWVAVLLARLLAFLLEEGLEGRGLPRGIPAAISRTAQYAVVAVGFAFATLASGMELTRFTVVVGTLGVGIGFGLQNVVNNFVSGLILLYERPVQVGDVVEVGTTVGTVQRIGIRSSTIATFQGAEVVVPNGNLISGELVNWTLSDRKRRIDVDVGVAYGSDPERVREVLLGILAGRDDVVASPEPIALFTGFGDSALSFQLRFWTQRWDAWVAVASDVRVAVARALADAGIEIPFPQRDLHLRSVAPGAAAALGGGPAGGGAAGAGGAAGLGGAAAGTGAAASEPSGWRG